MSPSKGDIVPWGGRVLTAESTKKVPFDCKLRSGRVAEPGSITAAAGSRVYSTHDIGNVVSRRSPQLSRRERGSGWPGQFGGSSSVALCHFGH